MDSQDVLLEVQDHVAVVTLNRPHKLNAFTLRMGEALTQTYEALSTRNDVRVIILTGAGRGFCSGADVGAFQSSIDEQRQGGGSRVADAVHSVRLHQVIYNCPKPTIAAINGPAIGAGVSLTLLQDLRIMAEEAYMGILFARMGGMPELGMTFLLPRLVGLGKALELSYLPKTIKAQEALDIGLVNQVVPGEGLMATVREMAGQIAAMPPLALKLAKQALYQGAASDFNAAIKTEGAGLAYLYSTEDHKEAVAAFLEKRPGKFQGK
ncbi:MAG: enoyl-CoA hydratase/isomerase family protein [Candidatus Binatia bacterium]